MTIIAGRPIEVGDVVTVYVPNRDGGYTALMLVRRAGGYIGLQGEFYPGNPTVAQLQIFYGL